MNKILLTGMGSSVGLLYSAISLVKPNTTIVLTSDIMSGKVLSVCQKALENFNGKAKIIDCSSLKDNAKDLANNDIKLYIVIMKDVFCGFNETEGLLAQIFKYFSKNDKLIVNITGGTTAMQWVMQAASEQASKSGIDVKRIAFADRRTAAEQHANPFVLGELIEIEKILNQSKTMRSENV